MSGMSCLAVQAVLDLFAEELLTPGRRAQVAAHLRECPACGAAAAALRAPKAAPAKAPSALKARLLKAASSVVAAPGLLPKPVRRDARAAAIVLAVFAFGLAALHALTPPAVSERPVASDAVPWGAP